MKAVVHVAGATALRGSYAYYDEGLCASTTLVPLARKYKATLIPILPHSLVIELDLDLNDFEGLVNEFLRRTGLENTNVRPRVVQVRGSFLYRGELVRFEGSPVHAFTTVYHELKAVDNLQEVLVDLSQGWNYLTVAAFLGATAFGEVYGVKVIPLTYEPFNAQTTRTCNGGERKRPSKRLERVDKTSLKLIELYELDDLERLIRSIAHFSSVEIRPRDLELAWDIFKREWDDETTFKPLATLRKVSCALRTNVIPYLHYSLRKLHDSVNNPRFKELLRGYEERVSSNYYVSFDRQEGVIRYRGVPSSYALLDATLQAYRQIWEELGEFMGEEWFPLKLVDRLISYYRERGMHINEYFLVNEFRYEKDFRRAGSSMESLEEMIRDKKMIGTASGFLAPFYYALMADNFDERALYEAKAYSYFMVRKPKRSYYDQQLVTYLEDVLLGNVQLEGRMGEMLEYAFRIIRGEEVSRERIVDLIRNLVAHAGIQHYSVRSLYPIYREGKVEDLKVYYYMELFEALDSIAKVRVPHAGCLCDNLLTSSR